MKLPTQMAGPSDWAGEMTALESRADVDSLDDLQHRRRELVEQNAHLIALYGSFGLHDDYRKAFVESQKIRARMVCEKSSTKATEGLIDAMAYGSEEYQKFLDNALSEKVEWLRVDVQITELEERIRGREIALRAYASEPK